MLKCYTDVRMLQVGSSQLSRTPNIPLLCCCSITKLCLTLCDPWTAAHQASLSFTVSWSLLKLRFIESVMPSNYLILGRPFSSPLALNLSQPQGLFQRVGSSYQVLLEPNFLNNHITEIDKHISQISFYCH